MHARLPVAWSRHGGERGEDLGAILVRGGVETRIRHKFCGYWYLNLNFLSRKFALVNLFSLNHFSCIARAKTLILSQSTESTRLLLIVSHQKFLEILDVTQFLIKNCVMPASFCPVEVVLNQI